MSGSMRSLALLVALLCALHPAARAVELVQPTALSGFVEQAAAALGVATADDGAVTVAGLRFNGGRLRSLLVSGGEEDIALAVLSREGGAEQLAFDQSFDGASDSWTVRVALPEGAAAAAGRLEVWCRACRSDASLAPLDGRIAALPIDQQGQPATSTVVLLLEGATLPAPAAAADASAVRRSLQQAAAATSSCSMTVQGKAYTFAACETVPTAGNQFSYKLHSSVVPSGAGSLLKIGIVAKTGGGWVGWAIPMYEGFMLGASAVFAWPTATGALIDGFKLPEDSNDEAAINKARGTFKISDAAAENVNGELHAVFTVSLPDKAASTLVAGPYPYIYAIGPVGGKTAPGLRDHTRLGGSTVDYPYGSGSMTLKLAAADSGAAAAPGTAGSPAATPSPSPSPAASLSPSPAVPVPVPEPEATGPSGEPGEPGTDGQQQQQQQEEGREPGEKGEAEGSEEGDGDGDEGTGIGSVTGSPSTGAAGGSGGAAGGGSSGCSLLLSETAAPQAFSGCTQISRIGDAFFMMWKSEPVANNPSKTLLTLGMNGSTSSGYFSVGFPSRAGRMSGASAMILQTCAAGSSGCTGGAKLEQWYMASTRQSDVQPDSRLPITNIQAAALPSGHLVGSFQMEVDTPATGTAGRRRLLLLQDSDGSMPLIFAAGGLFTDGTPRQHFAEGSGTLPVLSDGSTSGSGGSTDGALIEPEEENDALKSAHAWLAAIGWGVLVPLGIVMGRSFKDLNPTWFHLHRILVALGFTLGTIALGLGFELNEGWATDDHKNTVHRNLGMACTVLGATQFTAVVIRPKKGEKYRFAWELWHHWVGRAAAAVAIANIYYGMLNMWELGAWTWASYTAVLAVIVAVSVVKDASDWLRARKAGGSKGSAAQLTRPPSGAPQYSNGTAASNGVHLNGAHVRMEDSAV